MLHVQHFEQGINYIHTIFTAVVTISHLCKMTAATIQGRHLLQCNNDRHGYYSKTRQFFTVQIILVAIYYSVPS